MFERVVRQSLSFFLVVAPAVLLGACGSSDSLTQPLPVSARITLVAGDHTVLSDSGVTGAVEFPAAGSGGASYLIVGQLATTTSGASSVFTLGAQAFGPDLRVADLRHVDAATRFHDMLRSREHELALRMQGQPSLFRSPPARTPPPAVGTKRTFKVCANINCNTTKNVAATVQFLGAHAAIFVDDSVPSGGFSAADLSEVGTQFDQVLYPIDTGRFGAESDIDGNSVVIVLLTKQINALIGRPACLTSFITGFFFGADIDPSFASQYNNGEIFYGMVPDPAGLVSCPYSTAFVRHIIPVTFIHEFQHMISFNQHALVRGAQDEVLWLNEAMSHLAEELGGLHYDSLGVDSTANRFFLGDLYNAYVWMRDPANNAMMTETSPGSLEERGAEWLFLRYVADQYGPATTLALEQTSLTGAQNLVAATGTPFPTLLGRWGLAVYLNDAQGVTPPASLKYAGWNFRATYGLLHASDPQDFPVGYPLQFAAGQGGSVSVSGTLQPGGAAFVIASQLPTAAGFQMTFRGPNGAAVAASRLPQLAIFRIR